MKKSLGLSSALVAGLALTGTGCADVPTGPSSRAAPAMSASTGAERRAMQLSARMLDDEGARLTAAIRDSEGRMRLGVALDHLTQALAAGDTALALRALHGARATLGAMDSDADRDALRLTLDAVEHVLGTEGP